MSTLKGFGNEFESEAPTFEGCLPKHRANPQQISFNGQLLYTEQLSGSAFTAPRSTNKRSWLYRLKPSVGHEPFRPYSGRCRLDFETGLADPNQRRWTPFPVHAAKANFVEGLHTLAYSDASGCAPESIAIHIYLANADMQQESFVNADGDLLLVPQFGRITLRTEFGRLDLAPGEIGVVQQGMRFQVLCAGAPIRGYILEVRGNHFELPNLGPIGANGLANARDFEVPKASCVTLSEVTLDEHRLLMKFQNKLFECKQAFTPYCVAGWFGNYYPYKYDLEHFVAVNTVSVDHPDPSIFTVLTCPLTGKPGTALADFVIFPPRWECASDTFRPPYFHRNCMTEFMGLVKGSYQAKSGKFAPGGASLHQAMVPHGPDVGCYKSAINQDTSKPSRVADGTMAFMFETSFSLKLTKWALENNLDLEYHKCWRGF